MTINLDISNTKELERLHYAIGDFIFSALLNNNKYAPIEMINAIRNSVYLGLKETLETIYPCLPNFDDNK